MLMSPVCTKNEVVTTHATDSIENTDDSQNCFHVTVQFSECSLALCQAALLFKLDVALLLVAIP